MTTMVDVFLYKRVFKDNLMVLLVKFNPAEENFQVFCLFLTPSSWGDDVKMCKIWKAKWKAFLSI